MIRTQRAHLFVSADTHPGMAGKRNEDRYAVSSYRTNGSAPAVFAIVSDGIGGHRAGEIAAEIAVDYISQAVAESNGEKPLDVMEDAIQAASQMIYQQAQSNDHMLGMGATVACCWVVDNRLYTTTVGDSRIYLIRGDGIRQLNIDHTWVQEAIERGFLSREEARQHPNAHVIRRYLGGMQPPQVDCRLWLDLAETDEEAIANQGMSLDPGDVLVLCSDGLTDRVDDQEILQMVQASGPKAAVQDMIDLACERGGHDNITVIVLAVPEGKRKLGKRLRKLARTGCLAGGITAVLAALAVLGWLGWGLLQPVADDTPVPTASGTLPTFLSTLPADSTPVPTLAETPPVLDIPGPTYTPWPTNTPGQ